MRPYPKIETLYNRNPENMKRVVMGDLRDPAFGLVDTWLVTEKVDGTNVRVNIAPDGVTFGGRTDNAQMPMPLHAYLTATFPADKLAGAFEPGVTATLYGEGYGAKIQKAGGNYRPDPAFRLFDVRVGDWWLNWPDVESVAAKLGIATVPVLGVNFTTDEAIECVGAFSEVAQAESGTPFFQEGVVCRTDPLLLMRNGHRLVWKLKGGDLAGSATSVVPQDDATQKETDG